MIRRVAVLGLVLVALTGCSREPAQDLEQIPAKRVAAPLPFDDPGSRLWQQAAEHPVKLLKQDLTEPMLKEPGVELVKVRALHDGQWVVFRLEWEDATQDLIPNTGHGSDAAAVQFPLAQDGDVPHAAMGEKGKGVRIWYWKAVWQDDAERAQARGGDRIASLYPNAAVDHYPFNADPAAQAEMEKRYAPARAAGNPTAVGPGTSGVQVLIAEGFGTTRPSAAQQGRGHGQWVQGKWITSIARPLRGGAELGDLEAGKRSYVAFAIWDGAKAHTGSRKMRSEWVPLVLRKK
jgi:DMSO reductase family type II enzyme heme b subunit